MHNTMTNSNKGFTLGITLLISSVTLLISMSIFNMVYSEYGIMNISDQTSRAYYAADLGVECVKYYEGLYPLRGQNPNTSSDSVYGASGFFLPVGPEIIGYENNTYRNDIKCGGVTVTAANLNNNIANGSSHYITNLAHMPAYSFLITKFSLKNTNADVCVDVKVYKTKDSDEAITVVSRGYNTCNPLNGLRIAREVIYQVGYLN